MALVERLMGLADDGITPDTINKIPVHYFFAAAHQRADGPLTRQNVIDMFALGPDDVTEYDSLAALAPTGSSATALANRALWVEKMHAVCLLAEGRYAGYATPTLVRAKLGL